MSHHYDSKKTWRIFLINISLIIVLFISAIFLGFVIRTNSIIKDQMLSTAQSHLKNIVLTRRWNAEHGGVYVAKVEGKTSNPYLENPDITTIDGKVYTKKNPALMTREISEYAKRSGDFTYHITSLMPLNPLNVPDDFEKKALRLFEHGSKEHLVTEKTNGMDYFRYMGPLFVEKNCLACHAKQGYKVGDIRGGISVSFDISEVQHKMRINQYLVILASVFICLILLTIIYFMVLKMSNNLTTAYKTIELMAITDELTQLYNRRYFHSSLNQEISRSKRHGHSISLLMLDIDFFKRVNDNYGHQVGDEVLVGVSETIKLATRLSDIVSRYGGEEIAIILPETDISGAMECAEKIRKNIEERNFKTDKDKDFGVTVSIGAFSIDHIDSEIANEADNLIKAADQALYGAKANGRNKVVKYN